MRVAFIDPPGINRGLNIGLAMLAGVLKQRGYEIKVVDLNNNPGNIKNRVAGISKYDVIGVSIKSFTWHSACGIAGSLNRDDVICGGPHVVLDGTDTLRKNPNFKIAISGEAEELIIKLLEKWENSDALEGSTGVIYRRSDNPLQIDGSCAPTLVSDLDALPFADYLCFDSIDARIDDYPVITSRGCPSLCIYCCVGTVSGKRIRFRSIEKVIEEIGMAKGRYNSRSFSILDDNFTFAPLRAKEFCLALLKHGISMSWSCPNGIRADRLDEELVCLMARSGCRQVSIGIESWDDEVFLNIKKGEKKSDIREAIRLFNKYKIRINGFFMIGLPEDSLKKSSASLGECRKLGLTSAHWNLFVPYPGTAAWGWVKDNARMIRDWREGFHFGKDPRTVFETPQFREKDKVNFYKIANIKCRNYSAFFEKDRIFLLNMINILWLVLRYDILNLFSHLGYVLKNLISVRKYAGRNL